MLSSSTTPLTEYVIKTPDGRYISWSAFDTESLKRHVAYSGNKIEQIMTYAEYEAEQYAEYQAKINQAINLANKAKLARTARLVRQGRKESV